MKQAESIKGLLCNLLTFFQERPKGEQPPALTPACSGQIKH
jgi:hypothetical protein